MSIGRPLVSSGRWLRKPSEVKPSLTGVSLYCPLPVTALTVPTEAAAAALTLEQRSMEMRATAEPTLRLGENRMNSNKRIVSFIAAASMLTLSWASNATVLSSTGSYAPDCSGAAASQGVIWPPDHSMVAENIVGVTDPFGLATTIVVTGIQQDEPVEADGSGNTEPDGSGIGTSTAYVRAERAGSGTGRLYFISFSATDSTGAQCTGMVQAYVPHDQGQGFVPMDTGQRYDSTVLVD